MTRQDQFGELYDFALSIDMNEKEINDKSGSWQLFKGYLLTQGFEKWSKAKQLTAGKMYYFWKDGLASKESGQIGLRIAKDIENQLN